MRFYRPTWAEVNLKNLAHNFRQVKKILSPSTKVMVTVKADAYGHGLIPVADTLQRLGVDYFGVASIDEGIALRKAKINSSILVLGMILKEDIEPLFRFAITPMVCTLELAKALNARARVLNRVIKVHVKVDTGMGRVGALPADALTLIGALRKLKNIEIEGLFTHFAFADLDKNFTHYQIRLFNELADSLKKSGFSIPFIHAANSIGVINYAHSHFTMVRPGLVIYGLYPKSEGINLKLKPLLSLKTRIVFTKRLPKGCGISYGHIYLTPRETTIVTLPIGYGDGYPRNLANKAPVLIHGKRFKVCGQVCMDQIMVDVGNAKVRVGDEAVLIGRQGTHTITTEELAGLSGTIPYEIVCGLGSRIPRVYLG